MYNREDILKIVGLFEEIDKLKLYIKILEEELMMLRKKKNRKHEVNIK